MRSSRIWVRIRRFARETLVIILGVLIALIVQHYYSEWRDGVRIGEVRSAMDGELRQLALDVRARQAAVPCADRRLAVIDGLITAGRAFTIENDEIGQPTFRVSPHSAFAGASPDQLRRHLGTETVQRYSALYQHAAVFTELSWRERESWVVLGTLAGDVGPLSVDRRTRLHEVIATARDLNGRIENLTRVMIEGFEGLDIPTPASTTGSNAALCARLTIRRG